MNEFLLELCDKVECISKMGDGLERQWIMEVSVPGREFDEFPVPRHNARMVELDSILREVLTKILPQGLRIRISNKKQSMHAIDGTPMSGRQVLWMIVDSFKVTNTIEGFHTLAHLYQIQWYGR